MRNLKLTIAYDGADFHGWQVQPSLPTIQGRLNDVLSRVTQSSVFVQGAGRTDAGVHALAQVAHFNTDSAMPAAEFHRALNALLPPTIRIIDVEEAPLAFHARHSATGKAYAYHIFCGPVLPPFLARYALHCERPLDEEAMISAARHFEGQHDFTAFSASPELEDDDGNEPTATRIIWKSALTRGPLAGCSPEAGFELIYRIHGRSFLRYMVRKIVGTLLEVGRGRIEPAHVPELLAARDRARTGPTAPPQGLFLEAVSYEREAF